MGKTWPNYRGLREFFIGEHRPYSTAKDVFILNKDSVEDIITDTSCYAE
jgi:hypothetical protein